MTEEKSFAPIVIFLYNRPDKTRRMIQSLAGNIHAGDSDVYIYCDGPGENADPAPIDKVREYADSIVSKNLFGRVTVTKSSVNRGLANSVIKGVTEIINMYGRAIVLEDDLVLSRYFLEYMNRCLDHYENDTRIWSISGHTPGFMIPKGYKRDVYLNYRASSWGWATWRDRWDRTDWEVRDYASFKHDLIRNIRFMRGGNDLPSMLRAQMHGNIDSWAVRWCYNQSTYNKYSLAPIVSLVSNDGMDGSGTNSKEEDAGRYSEGGIAQHEYDWCPDDLKPDIRVLWRINRVYHLSIWVRIRDKYRQITGKR